MALVALSATPNLLADHDPAKDSKMNVFFRFFDGKTFCLWLDPDLDIYAIKAKLLHHTRSTGQAPSTAWFGSKDLFFCWNGKPLDDDAILKDYGVRDSATISVSYRKRGGCFMVSLSILTVICAAVIGSPCTCGFSLFIVPLLLPLLFVLPLFCL